MEHKFGKLHALTLSGVLFLIFLKFSPSSTAQSVCAYMGVLASESSLSFWFWLMLTLHVLEALTALYKSIQLRMPLSQCVFLTTMTFIFGFPTLRQLFQSKEASKRA
eukprot:GILK01015510.1.p1 GENE.GILK01015510.1~~GILK01015510.1.p1  ORF type:complete len:107 (-),score=8.01 GILK01015510.1:200-520(-)